MQELKNILDGASIRNGLRANNIVVSGVSKSYFSEEGQKYNVLDSINFEIGQSEFVSLVGPSGCGKTTMLKIICGLINPDRGNVTLGGYSPAISQKNKNIGFVFQDPALLPWRTVIENIRLPLEINKQPNERKDITELVSLVGLEGFENHYPYQLSGGMRQRVSLARALSANPGILLMDEPFASLDEITRESMRYELLRLWNTTKPTVLFVTHNCAEAVLLSDRVLVMSGSKSNQIIDIKISLDRPRVANLETDGDFNKLIHRIKRALKD